MYHLWAPHHPTNPNTGKCSSILIFSDPGICLCGVLHACVAGYDVLVYRLGFGLLFAYEKRIIWSAIGFNLLITCLTIEWFFMINLFWTKTNIQGQDRQFPRGRFFNNMFLWSGESNIGSDGIDMNTDDRYEPWGATMTQALRCALANCVAFSAILGRAGPLEAFFVALFGTIGFELNRNIVDLVHYDFGQTYEVFVFGGFMGLAMGFMLFFK